MESPQAKRFSFADFEIDVDRRLLFRQGLPVPLHSKAFDVLLALVENNGDVLGKDELLEKVWQGQFVEESNLTVHISALRKLFGEGKKDNRFIVTIPGRGYRFVAPVISDIDDNVVVESHSLRRIVVEEEIDEDDDRPPDVNGVPLLHEGNVSKLRRYKALVVAGAVLAILLLAVGGYFFVRRQSAKDRVPFQQISIRRLTTSGMISNAALSPDGKLFVYSLSEGDREGLWLGYVDGGEPVRIRPPVHLIYRALKFTPDGTSIYYVIAENFGDAALYKIPVFGGVPQKVVDRFRSLSFSPDQRQIIFVKHDESSQGFVIMTANLDGSDERKLVDLPNREGIAWSYPLWSPDGSKIALVAVSQGKECRLEVLDIASGAASQLTETPWKSVHSLVWLHDMTGLLAVAKDSTSNLRQVWHVSYPDGAARRVTSDLSAYDLLSLSTDDKSLMAVVDVNQSNIWVAPADQLAEAKQITSGPVGRSDGWNGLVWTKDAKLIYGAVTAAGDSIWMMNSNGSEQRQIVPSGGSNTYPSSSDDGRFLVFQSDRAGHDAAWRADLASGSLVQLTGDAVAVEPYISPDGKWVVYRANFETSWRLWRIPAEGGEAIRLTERAAGWPQISPDSKLVACEADVDGKTRLGIFSLETGTLIKAFDTPRLANLRLGVHWTPDGKAVAYRDWVNGIWRQEIEGGEPKRLEGLPEEKLFGFGWSPDGKQFAYSRGGTSRDVVLITSSNSQ